MQIGIFLLHTVCEVTGHETAVLSNKELLLKATRSLKFQNKHIIKI